MKDLSGGMEWRREVVGLPTYQRKTCLKTLFKALLLLSLITIPIGYMLNESKGKLSVDISQYHLYKRFSNGTQEIHKAPLYRSDPYRLTVQSNLIYPRNYHFILDDSEVCRSIIPWLVLVVPVAPANWKARDAIRRTWGNETRVQGELIQTVFLLGLPSSGNVIAQQERVHTENAQYHDLIQSDFMDSYHNLTIKTMVIMDWLATRCHMVTYAMKIDSDMFLNVQNLVSMLKIPGTPTRGYATGRLKSNTPVVREKNNQWYVSKESYPLPFFPTYAVGMGYIFSLDMPKRFVEVSKTISPIYVEDAYVGICMKTLGLEFTPPPNRNHFKLYLFEFNRCALSIGITNILKSSEQLLNYWTELQKPGPPC